METCPSCGARVGSDVTWCSQCFATLPQEPPAGAGSPLQLRGPRKPEPVHHQEFSRWKGSDTSFGAVGRIVLSVLVMLGLLAGYPLLRGIMVAFIGVDVPGFGFVVMYAVVATGAAIYLINRIWKPTRVA